MRLISAVLILFIHVFSVQGQKISETFSAAVKNVPMSLSIMQHTDGNYLVYGDINYYENSMSGSLIKVDQRGNLIPGFKKVFTDRQIENLVVLPNGKILIHGSFEYINGKRTASLVLLNADGTEDSAFKVDQNTPIHGFAVQSTGKIIVYSNFGSPLYQGFVGRLNSDGTLDLTFTSDFNTYYIYQILTGANDEIYVRGNGVIYRLNSDGVTDNTFTLTGDASTGFGFMAIQPDGKLLIAITKILFSPSFSMVNSLQRVDTHGAIDNSFSAGNASQQILSMVIRKNGKIAITGFFTSFDGKTGSAIELNSDGSVSKGLITVNTNAMYSIYEDANENIFVTGRFKKVVNNTLDLKHIAKIKPDYSVDLNFKLPVSRTAGSTSFHPMAYQSNGKILIGGEYNFSGVERDSAKLVRLLPTGGLDGTFSAGIKRNSVNTAVYQLAVQEDGKIILGGFYLFDGLSSNFGRLLPDGQFDNSFQIGFGPTVSNGNVGAIQAIRTKNNSIYLAGLFDRFNGQPCQSFVVLNKDGVMIGPQQAALPAGSYIQDMEIQSNGKVVLMGSFPLSTETKNFIRLNTDGSIDNTFSLVVTGNLFDFDIDANDNILLTGNFLDLDVTINRILKRFDKDGHVDHTLNQGNGFSLAVSGYFVKSISGDRIALGGLFSGYDGTHSQGLVVLDKLGKLVPFENPFDSVSFPIVAAYGNQTLYMAGRFTRDHGQNFAGGAKMVFPITAPVNDFKVKAVSESKIDLSWSKISEGADKLIIERSSTNSGSYEKINTISSTSTSFQDAGLSEVADYYYQVTSANDGYQSAPLIGHDTTFIAPQLSLPPTEITTESFTANWTYIPATDSCLLQISKDSFTTFVNGYQNKIVKSGTKKVEGLEDGKIYQYRVKRFKNGKTSSFSEPITVNVILGTDEQINDRLEIFPNPSQNVLTINLPDPHEPASATMHTADGKFLGNFFLERGGSSISVDAIPIGLYILTVSYKGRSQQFKVIKSDLGN